MSASVRFAAALRYFRLVIWWFVMELAVWLRNLASSRMVGQVPGEPQVTALRGCPTAQADAWLGDGNRAVLPRVAGSVVEPRLVRDSKLALGGAATLSSGCNTLASKACTI